MDYLRKAGALMENIMGAFNVGTSAYAQPLSSLQLQEKPLEIKEVFRSDTPDNVDNLSSSELLQYVVKGNYKPSPAVRLRVLNMIYDVLGYDKENEVIKTPNIDKNKIYFKT